MPHKADTKPAPFGSLLGLATGNVGAYSSDYATIDEQEYPKRSLFRSYVDGIYMGYKWQCVEFARRWMYLNHGYIFDDVSMAYEIFHLGTVREIKSNRLLPLKSFRNGSKRHPQAGALLIWEAGGEFQDTGHVAVISEVFSDRVRLSEQNVDHSPWPPGQNYCRELNAKITPEGDYWLECSFNDATILGWVIQTDASEHAEPIKVNNPHLLELMDRSVEDHGQANKSWLNVANKDEFAYVQMMSGHKLSSRPEDQTRYFILSQTAQQALEHATNELHALFMHATEYVFEHTELLNRFNLPKAIVRKVRQSWDNRLNQLITSRFDFSMSPRGLKVYEYNCDSASCYMESGKVQGKWGKHFGVKEGQDAGRELFKHLVDAWRKSDATGLVHILQDDDAEETYHALFMQEAIEAADRECRVIVGLDGLNWDSEGNILDPQGDKIRWVWKTWAWETALDQIRAECEADEVLQQGGFEPRWQTGLRPRLADVLLRQDVMVYEPLWTLIPSNKAILPILWRLFPNHPLLLNTSFELTDELKSSGYVIKPIVGRCGENIQLVNELDHILEQTSGQFNGRDQVFQELFPLPKIGNLYVQVCTFTAAGVYAGSVARVDSAMIMSKDSDCMALRNLNDEQWPQRPL